MAKGSEIVVTSEPKGVFHEGIIDDIALPGVCLQIKAATEPQGGRYVHELYGGASGGITTPLILRADKLQGKTVTDAYAVGDRCFMYSPTAGEHMNVVLGEAGAKAIGDKLMIETLTGRFIDSSTPVREFFEVMETHAGGDGALCHVRYTGH